jgi:hypothetical protein
MNGFVSGGWAYVLSAYAVTVVLLGGYVVFTTLSAVRKVTGAR